MEGVCLGDAFGHLGRQVVRLRLPLSNFDLEMRFYLRFIQKFPGVSQLNLVKTLKEQGEGGRAGS